MAEDLIRYDILAQDALRGVVRKVLSEVARTGLPGEHHFFISFATRAPGVRISSRLLAQYAEEMTIVLQHQYWDLAVSEQSFEVGLSFNGVPERLLVPFSAIKGFVDPSVQFGLQFETQPRGDATAAPATPEAPKIPAHPSGPTPVPTAAKPPATVTPAKAPAKPVAVPSPADAEKNKDAPAAEVVSLDAFRKK